MRKIGIFLVSGLLILSAACSQDTAEKAAEQGTGSIDLYLESGLGNHVSLYTALPAGPVKAGAGLGYYRYQTGDGTALVDAFEPSLLISYSFENVIFRFRPGISLLRDGEWYLRFDGEYENCGFSIIDFS